MTNTANDSSPVILRQYGSVRAFSAAIMTVKCFQDNALLKSILEENGAGRVLVIDGGRSLHTALMGDMIAKIAVDNGWAGIIMNGAVRDGAVLSQLPIGVKASSSRTGNRPRRSGRAADVSYDAAVARLGWDIPAVESALDTFRAFGFPRHRSSGAAASPRTPRPQPGRPSQSHHRRFVRTQTART
jgi:regulator of ribonuclease activity A